MIRSDLQLTNNMMNASSNLPLNAAVNISSSSNNHDIKQQQQQQQQQAQQAVGGAVGVNNVTTTVIANTTTTTTDTSNTAASSINNNDNNNDGGGRGGGGDGGHDITQQTNKSIPRSNAWPTLMSGSSSSDRRDGNHHPTQAFHKAAANNEPFPRQRTSSLSQNNHHGQEQLSKTNLYIRGLQTTTKDQDLDDMCNRYGQISSSKAILDKNTGLCRGYGFVEFVSVKSAEIAVRELTKSGIQAQMAKITSSHLSHNNTGNQHHNNNNKNNSNNQLNNYNNQKSTSKNSGYNNNNTHHISSGGGQQHNHNSSNHSSSQKNHADPTNLYIANLPINMSEPELEELLSDYGNIVSTRILRDESNNPRGVGFARMESRDKCEEIIEQLNGRTYKGSSEPLVVKFADGGNKKRHHYNNNHHHHNNNNSNHHNHLIHHKVVSQDESRWQDSSTNLKDVSAIPSYEHHQHGNMSHSNQTPDLAMMSAMRVQPGYLPSVTTGGAYPSPLGPPSSTPQWIHPAGGQPYVVPPQMTQTGGLSPSGQAAAAAAAAAMHYGPHIPHLAAQMQSLQLAHGPPAHLGGYLPPQHHWPTLWPHPIPQQSPSPMGRLSAGPGPNLQTGPPPMPGQQHLPQLAPMQHQPSQIRLPQPQRLIGQQATVMDNNKLHVSVPL